MKLKLTCLVPPHLDDGDWREFCVNYLNARIASHRARGTRYANAVLDPESIVLIGGSEREACVIQYELLMPGSMTSYGFSDDTGTEYHPLSVARTRVLCLRVVPPATWRDPDPDTLAELTDLANTQPKILASVCRANLPSRLVGHVALRSALLTFCPASPAVHELRILDATHDMGELAV